MIIQDDRTADQRTTHPLLIGGTDRFLSGWGQATGGKSYAFWACPEGDRATVLSWVSRRGDLQRIREVYGTYRPRGQGHCHIYVWTAR